MSLRSVFYYINLVLLFLLIPLFFPPSISAIPTIDTTILASSSIPATDQTPTPQPSLWTQFLNWLFGLFVKTDYKIDSRPLDVKNQDMTNYSDIRASGFDQKHSFAGSRLSDINSQNCLKGNVIKNVILKISGYPNPDLSKICLSSAGCTVKPLNDTTSTNCTTISIDDLAHYFVQQNQPVYCAPNSNQLINLDSNFITAVKAITFSKNPIPVSELDCYQKIYDDFYITPKGNTDNNEENAKKIVQTPINADSQNPGENTTEIKNRVDDNFTPANYPTGTGGLYGLRPDNWDEDSSEADLGVGSGANSGVSSGTCNALQSHCEGMSIYGALGLSQSGKNYQEILKFYYGNISLKTLNTSNLNITVNVSSGDDCSKYQPLNLETYLSGLGEMPNYWGSPSKGGYETMKALVVAARTFAYMYTENLTKPICTTSNCQVFRCNLIKTMPYLDQAIKETSGQIIVDYNNQTPFITLYARSFCGPSKTVVYPNHTNYSVNGYEYELKARNGEQPFCINN